MKHSIARRRASRLSATVVLAALNAIGAGHSGPKPVLDPSQGDGGVSAFYVWDKEVPVAPGRLLRQEELPESLMLANASKGVRVLYTSTNGIDGKTPIAVSGAVYLPKGSPPAGGWPIIAWAHGTVGVADVCAPSWAPRSQRDTEYLNAWLAQGYAIAATDYQGLGTPGGHPWLVFRPGGWSVLDSARSALRSFPELANTVVIVGQSQGSQAALSAALLAREYAPAIRLKGTVATGVLGFSEFVPETKAPQIAGHGIPRGNLPLMFLYTFKALDSALNPSDYLSDAGKSAFEAIATGCAGAVIAAGADRNLLKKSAAEVLAKSVPYLRYPPLRFMQPVFIGTGLADTTLFPEDQYNIVMAACFAGSTVEAHYYPGQDHGGTVNASLVDSVPFVKKVLSGRPIANSCASVKPPASIGHTTP